MSKQNNFPINYSPDNEQLHQVVLQLQILKLKLKEEKLRDKEIYQSIKNKIANR